MAVGVIVAHLKIVVGRAFMQGHQSVGTHTKAAVADVLNLTGRKERVLLSGVHEHKVVASTI
jgi:hypothetical protein